MENQTSFDLNHAIHDWRRDLQSSPALRGEDLDELESHLRESTATLQTTGLSAEESFLIAARRIGQPAVLETEFGKVNAPRVWLDRILWMLIGFQLWSFVLGLMSAAARTAVILGLNFAPDHFAAHGRAIPVALLTVAQLAAFFGSLALCWWLFCKKWPRINSWATTLLHSPSRLVLTFGALCLILWFSSGLHSMILPLLVKYTTPQKFSDLMFSQSVSFLISFPTQTAVFLALTFFLARKRLRRAAA